MLAEILKQYKARMGATPLDMQLVMRNVSAILSRGEEHSESEQSSQP
jgi:hypothetical protein